MFQPASHGHLPPASSSTPSGDPAAAGVTQPQGSLLRAIELGALVESLLDLAPGDKKTLKGVVHQVELPFPFTTLWRALAIYRWSREVPEISQCRHIGLAHLSVLLGVPAAHRLSLLRVAEDERWSRRKLQTHSAALKSRQRLSERRSNDQ